MISNPAACAQAHPRAVIAANAAALPIMLATRPLPEMEAEQAALLAAHRTAAGALPLGVQYEATGVRTTPWTVTYVRVACSARPPGCA